MTINWFKFASPVTFYPLAGKAIPWFAWAAAALAAVEVIPSSALGVPEDAKEAFAFAILAYETTHGRAANLPAATGAKRAAILGKVCYAPPK